MMLTSYTPLMPKKGYKQTPEHIAKRAAAHVGRTHSEESKAKISAAKKGHQTGMTGKKHSPEARERMRQAHLGKNLGPEHPLWRGEQVSYTNLHRWIERHKPKTGTCSDCGEQRRTQWSNVDHRYRRERDAYVERCASCHKLYDRAHFTP